MVPSAPVREKFWSIIGPGGYLWRMYSRTNSQSSTLGGKPPSWLWPKHNKRLVGPGGKGGKGGLVGMLGAKRTLAGLGVSRDRD